MADVDMPDAGPSGSAKPKASVKSSKAGGDAASGDKKRFEVKKWNAVALWAWDIVVDNCAICRNHIMDLCMFEKCLFFDVTNYHLKALSVKQTRHQPQARSVR